MNLDRRLVDTVKANFARKSADQLHEIVRGNDLDRWSPEALAAAAELLDDRRSGLAAEPAAPEEDPGPPFAPNVPFTVALVALGALSGLGGLWVYPAFRPVRPNEIDTDLPLSFGPQSAWLAVETADAEVVAAALGLRRTRSASWAEGLAAAARASLFVSPPVGDWTLVTGTPLFPPEQIGEFVSLLLDRLGREFGGAQYFCTYEPAGLHAWARADRGRLLRGYARFGDKTLWDEGEPTKAERFLGFRFAGGDPAGDGPAVADEDCVLQLANLWSVDPSGLDAEFKEPVTGLLGAAAWTTAAGGAPGR